MGDISLKVLTYNIHKGFSATNLRFILHEIKNSLRHIDADIVFLQEVHGERRISNQRFDNWPNTQQFEFLADQVWHHYAYGKNAIYNSGHHGNAILSKYPIIEWDNINVSMLRSASRSLLHGVIHIPETDQKIHIICIHFGLFGRERKRQLSALVKRISTHVSASEPLIIAGDFNDWREQAEHYLHRDLGVKEVFKITRGAYARTFPAWMPVLSMDRIYYRGLDIIDCNRLHGQPWHRLSDHIPLLAEFRL
ncbi:endonuclease/exonuclease/phosphatase family protein [Nitrosomonas ureae]|uniref:Endonuclease/exonuclease/phosphatase family metal-dependent hydrolase n=1 Tax=Nitrosomonas ureae TaxID=44577 RepID=A0A1H9ACD9_9PROT|nr:endonuclease/exonuclease/phosphatase family protein [Nitrosomonas ureae]PTQ84837.1 endonuclease/exonuclease/phosphatase family metal-dependent hydrolase [Nitrosomonas ureae]SEP74201.1 Metal-dependent hydrolase, endonuclease/exonuclease/phosphatase family [Nitrosomonas ureae]SOD16567.1 Metal-dependent hydrolase, endonuclease/exonuclease/phosphatase family [Nitrosomonas ureae]